MPIDRLATSAAAAVCFIVTPAVARSADTEPPPVTAGGSATQTDRAIVPQGIACGTGVVGANLAGWRSLGGRRSDSEDAGSFGEPRAALTATPTPDRAHVATDVPGGGTACPRSRFSKHRAGTALVLPTAAI